MEQPAKLEIYRAQTLNVRMLDRARTQINRTINLALRRGDKMTVQVQTKVFALVFCAWVEANFSKIIHTPYGFTLDEIQQVKDAHLCHGLETGWDKCIELGLSNITNRHHSNYLPNTRQQLTRLVSQCVVEPSQIRNKIAHGQWEVALNRKNTAIDKKRSEELEKLNVVAISVWFYSYKYLVETIEALIESPNRAFHRDYWVKIAELENFLEEAKGWSMDEKVRLLKPLRMPTSG